MNLEEEKRPGIDELSETIDVRDGLNPALRQTLCVLNSIMTEDHFYNSSRVLKKVQKTTGIHFELSYNCLVDSTWPRCYFPLINGHGNFGFPPAYPDYSELKLTEYGKAFVREADSENFNIPFIMPIPYALVGGTMGYSYFETRIPTHNLAEVTDAMIAMIKNPDIETKELLNYIKGPDLLFGGSIDNPEELSEIYETGCGIIKIIVTDENINWRGFDNVKDYCSWYEVKCRKVYRKAAYKVEFPYNAFLYDGEKRRLMSLKDILKNHLAYYRSHRPHMNDEEICDILTGIKEQSSDRITRIKTEACAN